MSGGFNNPFCNLCKKYLKENRGGIAAQEVKAMAVGKCMFRAKAPAWILTSPVNGPE